VVVGVLSLGIGANAGVYSVMRGFATRRLPVSIPEELFRLGGGEASSARHVNESARVSLPDVLDVQRLASSALSIAAFVPLRTQLGEDDQARDIDVALVTGAYFSTLRLQPLRGRLLRQDEGALDQLAAVAVVSEALWRSYFGAAEDIIGRTVKIKGSPLTIVGVVPSPFVGTISNPTAAMWIPIGMYGRIGGEKDLLAARDVPLAMVFGRKQGSKPIPALQFDFDRIAQVLNRDFPAYHRQFRLVVSGGGRPMTADEETERLTTLEIVWFLVIVIHLIACSNVASILLARGIARRPEMATRMALGASRSQIVGQLFGECIVISVVAVGLGIAIAALAVDVAAKLPGMAAFDFRLDLAVVGLATTAGLVTSLLFGLAPALESARVDVVSAMKGAVKAGSGASTGSGFVSVQIALSVALLAFSGAALGTARRAAETNPGFDVEHLAFMRISLPDDAKFDPVAYGAAYERLRASLESVAGVTSVAASQDIPLSPTQMRAVLVVPGYAYELHEDQRMGFDNVSPGYFRTMGIPVIRGQDFDRQGYNADWRTATSSVVVNETFAKHYWHGADPIGREVLLKGRYPARVVGVVGDTRDYSLVNKGEARYYMSIAQSQFTLIVRVARLTPGTATELRDRVLRSGLGVQHVRLQLGSDLREESLRIVRTTSLAFQSLAILALTLASLGLYGLVSFSVEQKTAEFGLRIAIGARSRDIYAVVTRMTVRPTVIGLIGGVLLAMGVSATGTIQTIGIEGIGAVALIEASAILMLAAALAAIVPTGRALRIDPVRSLRGSD
jgi:predicted permease